MPAFEHAATFVGSSGTLLYDADGADYLDATGSAQSVGHANARVTDAISASAGSLGVSHPGARDGSGYAEDLLSTFPDTLDEIRFTSSASEANDLALRVARAITGGRGMIVTRNAYHGVTSETSAVSPAIGGAAALPGWVRVVDAPTVDSAAFARSVAAASRELADSEYGLCALLVDPVFASDGLVIAVPLSDAASAVRDSGGIVIADEVQSGFGRLGTAMWGFEAAGIVPDLVTVGKAMGNGMPIAAVVGGSDLSAIAVDDAGYSSSTAGDAVSLAAASAVLDCIRDDDLLANARSVGDYLLRGLALLASAGDALGHVRGSGLCAAIDVIGHGGIPDAARAAAIVGELARRRVLVASTGLHGSVMVIRPPLTCTIGDVDRVLEQLYGAILVVEPTAADDTGPDPDADIDAER